MLASTRLSFHERLNRAMQPGKAIRRGEQGAAITALQLALIDLGAAMPSSTHQGQRLPDGVFGQETERVVKAFQTREGLVADGIVGPKTLGRLDAVLIALSAESQRAYAASGVIDAHRGGG